MFTKEEILEHRKEWIGALRSGKYPQTKLHLQNKNGYCCLGVACELAGVPKTCDDTGWVAYDGYSSTLPPSAREWLGVTDQSPLLTPGVGDGAYGPSLASLNDDGKTFKEIADLVEQRGFDAVTDVLTETGAGR